MKTKSYRQNRRMNRFARHVLTGAAFVLFLSPPLCAEVSAPDDSEVQVSKIEGHPLVKFHDGGDWMLLGEDTPLFAGDAVRVPAKSRVEVITKDGDLTELQENTEVVFGETRPLSFQLKLILGSILAKVSPQPRKRFQVHTPVAVAAVRGTEFGVAVDESGNSEVGVTAGEVAARRTEGAEASTEEIILRQNEGAVVEHGRPVRHLRQLPPVLKRRMVRMAVLRERFPGLRGRWKDLTPQERRNIRRSLRERWENLPPERKQEIRRNVQKRRSDIAPSRKKDAIQRRSSRRQGR